MKRPAVYSFLDYRKFLKEMFAYKKQINRSFSYRLFAQKAGFISPTFLKLVIESKRNLTNESIAKMAKGFGLKKQERLFFENLVFMNQATYHEEKKHYYKRMMTAKGYLKAHKIGKASYDYFSRWYYPVIREIVVFEDRNFSSEEIAGILSPNVTVKEVEKGLRTLQKLKLIHKDESGKWMQRNNDITTGPEVESLIIANYHKEMLKIAAESIDRYPPEKRKINAMTMSIRLEDMQDIKDTIDSFNEELTKFSRDTNNSDHVIQINMQIFPLTNDITRKNNK